MVQNSAYRAYSAATRTVAKTRQIVMLYDGAIRFLKQAQLAIDENRIEDRFNLLKRVSDIMMGLQSSIDFENGGQIAHVLQGFYVNIANRTLMVNMERTNGRVLCEGIIKDIKQMRDVWDNIDQTLSTNEATAPAMPETAIIPAGNDNKILTVSA